MAEYSHLSEVDPEIADELASFARSSSSDFSFEAIRQHVAEVAVPKIQKDFEPLLPPSSEYSVTDHHIEVSEGVTVLARCITPSPRNAEETFPLMFWIHGGGHISGNLHIDDYRLRITSVKLRITTVNCEYRLAPEHPFPAGLNDLTAALKYVASNPEKFSASLDKGFIIGGSSAGGNMAAVLSWMARDDPFFNDKPVTGQLLHVPALIHHDAYPEKYKSSLLSLERNKSDPTITIEGLIKVSELYKGPPTDPRVSPLLLPSHKGLPAAFIQVLGMDPLRDEGLLYEKLLKEAGVPTKIEIYPGVPHAFESLFFNCKQAARSRENTDKGLQWLLTGAKPNTSGTDQ